MPVQNTDLTLGQIFAQQQEILQAYAAGLSQANDQLLLLRNSMIASQKKPTNFHSGNVFQDAINFYQLTPGSPVANYYYNISNEEATVTVAVIDIRNADEVELADNVLTFPYGQPNAAPIFCALSTSEQNYPIDAERFFSLDKFYPGGINGNCALSSGRIKTAGCRFLHIFSFISYGQDTTSSFDLFGTNPSLAAAYGMTYSLIK